MKHKISSFVLTALLFVGTITAQEKYAVLITGDLAAKNIPIELQWNNGKDSLVEAFWHDTYLMWEMLIKPIDQGGKGFSDKNVIVLFADGIDYPNTEAGDWVDGRYRPEQHDYDHITDYAADSANVDSVFQGLANGKNGFPQLTEDDFLVVWTFDHGWHSGGNSFLCLLNNEKLWDYELAALTDRIICNKKVFLMQQCASGGFVDDLENENTIIFTAANDHMLAFFVDELYFDGIDYPGDTLPGNSYYSDEIEEWDSHEYPHGEYNYHLMNAFKGETPAYNNLYETEYINFPLQNADANNDNLISIYEAAEWVYEFDSRQAGIVFPKVSDVPYDDPQWSDIGNIGNTTSLEYPTILNTDIFSSLTVNGIVGIPVNVHINLGAELTFDNNSRVDLFNNAKLIIEEGANLIIGDNVTFEGKNSNNSIIVHGNLKINGELTLINCNLSIYGNLYAKEGANITCPDGQEAVSVTFRSSYPVSLQNVNFSNLMIGGISDLEIMECTFTNTSFVKYSKGNINIENSDFTGSSLNFTYSFYSTGYVNVRNCNFSAYSGNAVINIDAYPTYIIENNNITSNNAIAIAIYNSGDHPIGQHLIAGNTLLDNFPLPGQKKKPCIRIYNSVADIASNTISGSSYGISCKHNSKIAVYGDKELSEQGIYQMVYDNTDNQVIAIDNSFPVVFEYNVIHSFVNNNPLVDCSNNGFTPGDYDVRNNCWGDDFRPQDDLNPYSMFIYNPVWNCGVIPSGAPGNPPKELYGSAFSDIQNENFSSANTKLKQIVTNYPDSKYATASLKDMVTLTGISSEDYEALKEYFGSEPNIINNDQLKKLAGYLKNKCEIKQKNYAVALQFYEDIIEDPETPEDSIYAAIDAGHLYYLMEEEENKAACIWKIPEMKPETMEDYISNREFLLSMLKGKNSEDNNNFNLSGSVDYILYQNSPNPFTDNTEIKFIIKKDAGVSIKLMNSVGKNINSYVNRDLEKGRHSVFISVKDMVNGIYYYTLEINGELVDMKKMVIIK